MDRRNVLAIILLLGLFAFASPPEVKADDFYKGKTVQIVVQGAGGEMTPMKLPQAG